MYVSDCVSLYCRSPNCAIDATLFFLSSQVSAVIYFFLSRNIRIARERAYDQTITSRGKGADWWRPYVEEWDNPPRVEGKRWGLGLFMSGAVGRIVTKRG